MNWNEVKNNFKDDVMANKPVAKVDENGAIVLETPDAFYQALDNFCDAGKAEVKKSAFKVAMLSALGLAGATVAMNIDPSLAQAVMFSAQAFALSGSMYIGSAFQKKKEAKHFYDHLEDNFKATAEEMYKNHEYYTIGEDGTIIFDNPEDTPIESMERYERRIRQ